MLENLVENLAEITLSFSVIIALLLLLTPIIGRRYTAKWRYWVWILIAVRIIFPLNITLPQASFTVETPQREIILGVDESKLPDISPPENPYLDAATPSQEELAQYQQEMQSYEAVMNSAKKEAGRVYSLSQILGVVWLAGVGTVLLWQVLLYLSFRRRIRRWAVPPQSSALQKVFADSIKLLEIQKPVRLAVCPKVTSPMMTGIFSPVVLLPREDYDEETLRFILRHELVHLKRRDILYKQLMLLATAVNWFNPLVWLMAREANKDIEISCDDAVVRHMSKEQRRQYAEAILSCIQTGMGGVPALTTHFYGGKKTLKKRFQNLFDLRRKRAGLAALAIVLSVVLLASSLVGCQTRQEQPSGSSQTGIDPETSSSSASQQSSESASSESSLSSSAAGEEETELPIEEMLLNFGASLYSNDDGSSYMRTDVVSFYYLEESDESDLSSLSPDLYFSWYLSMSNKEGLTLEEKREKYASPFGENTGWFFPQEYYEPLVQQYFDVTTDYLRSGSAYQAEEKGYWLGGGGGVGIRPVILLYRAEQEGNLLRLYLTLAPGEAYAHNPNDYKILTLRMEEDGSYRYLRYETDPNPAQEQHTAGQRDNTDFSTGQSARYRNEQLGITVSFPESWENNYTVSEGNTYFEEFSSDTTGIDLLFFYKEDLLSRLASITAIPKDAWEVIQSRETPIGVYLGENEQYVFVGNGSLKNRFLDGPDSQLYDRMQIQTQDMPNMVTVDE